MVYGTVKCKYNINKKCKYNVNNFPITLVATAIFFSKGLYSFITFSDIFITCFRNGAIIR